MELGRVRTRAGLESEEGWGRGNEGWTRDKGKVCSEGECWDYLSVVTLEDGLQSHTAWIKLFYYWLQNHLHTFSTFNQAPDWQHQIYCHNELTAHKFPHLFCKV